MSRLQHLYQQMILDHNRNPRNFREIEHPSAQAHGHNPLCGDDYILSIKQNKNGTIEDIGFQGNGCAISKSSASMMTEAIKGKSVTEALLIKNAFINLLLKTASAQEIEHIGNLRILEGVKEFPVRVKCATLIWRTLESLLTHSSEKAISTE